MMNQEDNQEQPNPVERNEADRDTGPIKPPTRNDEEPSDPNEGEPSGAGE